MEHFGTNEGGKPTEPESTVRHLFGAKTGDQGGEVVRVGQTATGIAIGESGWRGTDDGPTDGPGTQEPFGLSRVNEERLGEDRCAGLPADGTENLDLVDVTPRVPEMDIDMRARSVVIGIDVDTGSVEHGDGKRRRQQCPSRQSHIPPD